MPTISKSKHKDKLREEGTKKQIQDLNEELKQSRQAQQKLMDVAQKQTSILEKLQEGMSNSKRLMSAREGAGYTIRSFRAALNTKLTITNRVATDEEYEKIEAGKIPLVKGSALVKACEDLLGIVIFPAEEKKMEALKIDILQSDQKDSPSNAGVNQPKAGLLQSIAARLFSSKDNQVTPLTNSVTGSPTLAAQQTVVEVKSPVSSEPTTPVNQSPVNGNANASNALDLTTARKESNASLPGVPENRNATIIDPSAAKRLSVFSSTSSTASKKGSPKGQIRAAGAKKKSSSRFTPTSGKGLS